MHPTLKKKRAKEGQWFDTSCKQGEPLFFSTKDQIVHFATLFATCSICWLHPINILTRTCTGAHCTGAHCTLYLVLLRTVPTVPTVSNESIELNQLSRIYLTHSNQLNHVSPPIKSLESIESC
jgi:hypothetical protein